MSAICGCKRGSPPAMLTIGAPHSSDAWMHSSTERFFFRIWTGYWIFPHPVQARLQRKSGSSISTSGYRSRLARRCFTTYRETASIWAAGIPIVSVPEVAAHGRHAPSTAAVFVRDEYSPDPRCLATHIEHGPRDTDRYSFQLQRRLRLPRCCRLVREEHPIGLDPVILDERLLDGLRPRAGEVGEVVGRDREGVLQGRLLDVRRRAGARQEICRNRLSRRLQLRRLLLPRRDHPLLIERMQNGRPLRSAERGFVVVGSRLSRCQVPGGREHLLELRPQQTFPVDLRI